jgi:hypothetical protein
MLTSLITLSSLAFVTGCATVEDKPVRTTGYRMEPDAFVFELDTRAYDWTTEGVIGNWVAIGDISITNVCVAGEFNSWSPSAWPLQRVDQHRFILRKSYAELGGRLRCEFKFVINGLYWVEPPPSVPNGVPTGFANNGYNLVVWVDPRKVRHGHAYSPQC